MDDEDTYSQMLKRGMGYEDEKDINNCCVNITTELMQYNFCFIEFETKDHLGVFYTHSDFTERFIIIAKKYIISMSVVYQQDFCIQKVDDKGYS